MRRPVQIDHCGHVVSALCVMLFLISACATLDRPWETPEVTLRGLQPSQIGLTRQVLIATLNIRNPNSRTLPVTAMTYRIDLEGQEVATGSGELERQIPAFGEATVDVEVSASLLSLIQQLPALAFKNKPLDWTVSGTAMLSGGLVTLPYRYSGRIDARELLDGVRHSS